MPPALARFGAAVLALALLALAGCSDAPFLRRSPPPPCTAQAPCRIRILFAYTAAGLEQLAPRTPAQKAGLQACFRRYRDWGYCLVRRMARDDAAVLGRALAASGVIRISGGRPDMIIEPGEVTVRPTDGVDADRAMRLDNGSSYGDGAGFNGQMLDWLGEQGQMRRWGRDHQIVVVFTGLQGPLGGCVANSVSRSGVVLIPGCMARDYLAGDGGDLREQLMFLHEVGHSFGAAHNDFGNPQPCRMAAGQGFAPTACAWETCLDDQPCARARLIDEPRAFCTLTGQYNFGSGDTFCRAHRGGERGTGWVLEYSHPGPCRTPGWEKWPCGDAGHDAATAMRARAPEVARRRAGE